MQLAPRRLALVVVLVCVACVQPQSARCKRVCARESECATTLNSSIPFDEKECVAACNTLESDVATIGKVQHHAECVMGRVDCREVLECP